MVRIFALLFAIRRLTLCLAVAAAIASTGQARAQTVVIVNGDPVTQFDIEQRIKLTELSTHKTPTRNDVVEELINEKLKIQLVKKFLIDGIDKEVDQAYANMARRMKVTPRDFTENLAKQGVKLETIKS